MSRQVLDRRQSLRRSMQFLVGLGVGAAALNLLGGGSPWLVTAADLPPGATYQATGFYERTAIGRETLVALVLVPLNGTAPPVIQDGPVLERRDLGSATLETFRGQIDGMQQRILFDHGALRAVVYSARTLDGEYAQEKRYLIGKSELEIENPRARVQKIEGGGGHGGGGSGSGGGSGGGGM